jgi:alanyl aminopeptidase
VPDELRAKYAKFIRDMFGARARSLGWTAKPQDTEDDRLLRPIVLHAVAIRGEDAELIAQAKQLAAKYLKTGQGISPEMIPPVLGVAARYGDREYYEQLISAAKSAKDRRVRLRFIAAIGDFDQPEIVRSALGLLLTTDFDIRDLMLFFRVFQDTPETERLAWEFVKTNYDNLSGRLPSRLGVGAAASLPAAAGYMCDEKGKDEVAAFFSERFKDVSGGERVLRRVLETIELCGPRRTAQRPGVEKFLREY